MDAVFGDSAYDLVSIWECIGALNVGCGVKWKVWNYSRSTLDISVLSLDPRGDMQNNFKTLLNMTDAWFR